MKVWVLTRVCNDYNQYGEYFEACFKEKPSPKQLNDIIRQSKAYWGPDPDDRYNLLEIEYGQWFEGCE